MNLSLWAQLNLYGHVSYSEYLAMSPEEAMACFKALEAEIQRVRGSQGPQVSPEFEALCKRHGA